MRNVKDPNQLYIFDPWEFFTPKRRQMLETGWPGLFQEHILPLLPVGNIAKHFDSELGRPTKELYAMLGALILQQTFGLGILGRIPISKMSPEFPQNSRPCGL
jgi:hypothetical protein